MFSILKKAVIPNNAVIAAATGKLIPLDKVKDEVFAKKMLGEGVAIIPDGEVITAPCSGYLTIIYPTLHAFGIKCNDGLEILVHIGIDTVKLNGKGFKCYMNEGEKVQAGDKIIRFDSYLMNQEGYDMSVMILFPNCNYELCVKNEGYVKKGKSIIATYK